MEESIKILLLEDNLNDVELIRYQISKYTIKCEFKHVSELDDFSKAIDEYIPDIILSDYNLIGFTGIDALELVKQKCRLTPFIIVTGTIDEETAAETIKKGAWDYIVKERLTRLDSAMKNAIKLKDEKEKGAIDREKLKISEERFELAMTATQDGLYDWNLLTNEIYYSPGWKSMLGYKDDELQNDLSVWEKLIEAKDAEKSWKIQQDLINKQRDRFEMEFKMKHKNGHWVDILSRAEVVYDENGKAIRMVGTHIDISERKLMENELIKAKEKAEESDRLKSAFLANMSHEIRTPMNGILGFINLLNEPDLSKVEVDEYSAIINRSGKRLLTTINDIIDISRIESGEVLVFKEEISINSVMDELYSFYLPEAKQKGLTLLLKPAKEQLKINTDSHKLHGILTNLIKNAIKYTEKGSVTFGYDLTNDADAVPNEQGLGSEVEFFVEDTGSGVPKGRIQAIFKRFDQADIEDTRALEGSGLGLAISKAYIEMLEGEIFVESEHGKGSKFSFTIPLNKDQIEDKTETTETIDDNTSKFGHLNLLIVDDDDVSLQLLKALFKGVFQKVIFAKNGIEAIPLCKNNSADLVLMDIKMPEMDGYEATREIRKFDKDLVIIAQTAYAMVGDKEKAIEAGCSDYISKPINKKLLLEIISRHIVEKGI